jgi:hypothetical protein
MLQTQFERGKREKGKFCFIGDCDCSTITILAGAKYLNLPGPYYINLVGKTRLNPTHIYPTIGNKIMDLTNKEFNYERPYKFHQKIKISL